MARERSGLVRERGGMVSRPAIAAEGGIDPSDLAIQKMGLIANARPGDIRKSVLEAIIRKRMVGSIGSAMNVPRTGVPFPFFQWKEEDERVVSINLVHDVDYSTDSNPLQSARAVAVIDYGAGGARSQVEVDVKRSCSFSLVAGFVNCAIKNISGAVAGSSMPIAAWLTDRAVANPVPPTLTKYGGALLAAGFAGYGVPKCAARVRFLRAPANADYTLSFQEFGTGEIVDVAVAAGAESGMIELPCDCSAVIITNGAVPMTRQRLIFELSL